MTSYANIGHTPCNLCVKENSTRKKKVLYYINYFFFYLPRFQIPMSVNQNAEFLVFPYMSRASSALNLNSLHKKFH